MTDEDVDVQWQGLDTLIGALKQVSPRATTFLRNEMMESAYDAFDESQTQVPVRYGILKGSGSVEIVSDDPIEIVIGYGGSAAGYAYWVHENLEARHKPPTKAKYLEDPVTAAMTRMPTRVQARVEGAIMGQYPQQASIAQGTSTGGATVAHTGGKSHKGSVHKGVVARAAPMTREDIRRALDVIDTGKAGRRTFRATVARGVTSLRPIRTFHKKKGS